LVKLVEDQLRILITLDVEDDTHGFAFAGAAFVADSADALDALVLDEFADFLGQSVAGLLVGHLLDDDLNRLVFLVDPGAGAERHLAAAGAVAVDDALPAADDAARRKIGAG